MGVTSTSTRAHEWQMALVSPILHSTISLHSAQYLKMQNSMYKPLKFSIIVLVLPALFYLTFPLSANSKNTNQHQPVDDGFLLGSGRADITGPAFGIAMWGFGYDGQVTEGIHQRLHSRAFIIAEPNSQQRLLFVSADIGSIEHNITLEVIDRLKSVYGELYTLQNVILSATHTHSGPTGYWHSRSDGGLSGAFYQEHFESIVSGIVQSVKTAHNNLQTGSLFINSGDVENAGINRSRIAYEQNPAAERAKYSFNTEKKMTLLKFTNKMGAFAMLNWFAVHPTSMTYYNRLISGDHKGYAAREFERLTGDMQFVGAFAQSTPGDVTANLNLDNTGPGVDDFDSTKIIGTRQLEVALSLFETANEKIRGSIDYRQIYVNLANYSISDEFTAAGPQITCPSAYGYSFAGGSSEDGAGHFLFEEGMTEQSFILDFLVKITTGSESYSEKTQVCQHPKPILWETGTGSPPLQSQIRSVSIIRIGQLAILALPTEVTTMAARRLKNTVMSKLGGWAKHIVIAGYSNGYAGYVTTPEEYRLQQYEGGHTLHGQWSLPAYQQIAAQLAQALQTGTPIASQVNYDDWRGKSKSMPLAISSPSSLPKGKFFGEALPLQKTKYVKEELVKVQFWSSNPTSSYPNVNSFIEVRYLQNGQWITIANDADWSTKIHWSAEEQGFIAEISWQIPDAPDSGQYKIIHSGRYTDGNGNQVDFNGASGVIQIE